MRDTTLAVTLDGWPHTIRLRFESRRCRVLGVAALVWRDTIYFATAARDTEAWVVAHELIHVWQWRTSGHWYRHVWRYLRSLRDHGYLDCPYERQAMIHQSIVARGGRCQLRPVDGDGALAILLGYGLHAPTLATWDRARRHWPRGNGQLVAPIFTEREAWEDALPDPGTWVPRNNDADQDGA